MRLTLWQQFASNHSNSFTVIGEFKSHDDAHTAYLHVRRVLRRIIIAHQRGEFKWIPIPEEERFYYPSDVEIEAFKPYGIVPQRLSDWTTYKVVDEATVHEAVQIFGNHVFV